MVLFIVFGLYLTCFICNCLDAYQTILLINLGATEINPLMNFVIEKTGTLNSIWVVKISIFAVLGALLIAYFKKGMNDEKQ